MSLLRARLALPAAAALLAVATPFFLLRGGGEAPSRRAAAPVAAPPREVTPTPAGTLSFALTAPPFDPDRTPGAAAAAAAPEAAPPPPAQAALPTLVGVAAGGRGRAVALVRGANGETQVLTRGQSVDGWRLVGIGRQDALFELNGERRTARLDFSNKGGGQAPAPAPPPPRLSSPDIPPPSPAREP